jgi:methyl-accepting chemotaxis protein
MGLRTKLFFPAILGFVLIASAIHFYWIPEYLADQHDHFIQEQVKLLSTLEPELANSIINGDLAALHASLNRQLDLNRPAWLAVSLHNLNDQRLYPINAVTHFSGSYIYSHKHPITFGDNVVAMLDLDLDWQPAIDIKLAQIHRIELLILAIIGLIVIASIVWLNIVFRRPLERLERAAARLSEGDFSAPLPKQNHDEIGNLARSFAQMRSSLQASQADLSAALLESQNNADKYRLEVKFREALYELQEISLSSTNRQELLDRTLQKLMSLEFLTIAHKGVLFLATDEAGVFQRGAKFNLDTALETQTTRVTFTSQTGDEKKSACL